MHVCFYEAWEMRCKAQKQNGMKMKQRERNEKVTLACLFISRLRTCWCVDDVCGRYLSSESAFTEERPVNIITQCCAQWSISLKHILSRLLCPAFGRHRGNYLVTLYLLVKLLYIANVVGQLYMLNALLGASYHTYGVDVINAMVNGNGTDWTASPMFPRVTLCDLRVRVVRVPSVDATPLLVVISSTYLPVISLC